MLEKTRGANLPFFRSFRCHHHSLSPPFPPLPSPVLSPSSPPPLQLRLSMVAPVPLPSPLLPPLHLLWPPLLLPPRSPPPHTFTPLHLLWPPLLLPPGPPPPHTSTPLHLFQPPLLLPPGPPPPHTSTPLQSPHPLLPHHPYPHPSLLFPSPPRPPLPPMDTDSLSPSWTRFAAHNSIIANQDGIFFDGPARGVYNSLHNLYLATREPFAIVGFDIAIGSLAFVRLVSNSGRRLFLIGDAWADDISRRRWGVRESS